MPPTPTPRPGRKPPPPPPKPNAVRALRTTLGREWREGWIGSLRAGVRLGLLSREQVHALDERYYSAGKLGDHIDYAGDEHNRRGLMIFEKYAVQTWFPPSGRLMVLAAGGGREVLALARMGYQVDGYEPHPGLAAFANDFLAREGVDARVHPVERDRAPRTDTRYDGVIVGWAAYTLIQGRATRVALLRGLRELASPGAPLLVSFWLRELTPFRHGLLTRTGNALRALRRREPLDDGDALCPNFVHFFTEPEVLSELRDGGWDPVEYDTTGTGNAVARAA